MADNIGHISISSSEQSHALSEITQAVRQLDELTQRNAEMVEHAVAQSADLENRASTLSEAVAAFRLQQGTADEALQLMNRAVRFRDQTSLDGFLRGITDAKQKFFDRDMYVFVLDAHGTYLSFGGNPAKVGTRVQDIPGIDGNGLIQAIVGRTSVEPGWVIPDHQPGHWRGADQDVLRAEGRQRVRRLRRLQEPGRRMSGLPVYRSTPRLRPLPPPAAPPFLQDYPAPELAQLRQLVAAGELGQHPVEPNEV